MLLALGPKMGTLPAKYGVAFNKKPIQYQMFHGCVSIPKSSLSFKTSLSCYPVKGKITVTDNQSEGFSVLSSDIPWEKGSIWTITAFYIFNLHIPLGIGGLSIVAYLLHQSVLDPQTKVLSLLVIQILELGGVLVLLRTTAKSQYELSSFFTSYELPKERNWMFASVLGFGFLTLLVFFTSYLAGTLVEAKDVNNPILKEILVSGSISKTVCVLVSCFLAPLLEEIVYRGFLLTCLASTMNWQKAVFLSSIVFSAAHFSVENFLQLFIVGCVFGCCYCWTGNLSSSVAVHSLYNALTLFITFMS